ncbi:hypothetical protein K470DRAFT_254192 [Piedraia hortae CBS 480.64]|uniref:SH3 domain-containing protein n=1 Tax=Piedraia hortae CBS 480.64 TaxID=1314780 RepID=A0A6A7CBR5_9PEZI|nr:hypothetical protein K470DRAFT_254192 [Piedraia hortae CBS 480.64]
MMGAPQLPTRFPCWCRATYSWGGETKKDLGFIEGDLIEALNAGDGLWWMGRLRRDPRAIGLFPTNFVQVLDENFQPAPISRNNSPQTQTAPKSKSMFRKPFDAYEKLGPKGLDAKGSPASTSDSGQQAVRRERAKFRPYSSMKTAQAPMSTLKKQASARPGAVNKEPEEPRIPAPPPRRMHSRAPSIAPSHHSMRNSISASPTPTASGHQYRPQQTLHTPSPQPSYAPSPGPSPAQAHFRPRSPLPATYHDGSAYPQLLPASRQPANTTQYQAYSPSRAPSPAPSSYQPANASQYQAYATQRVPSPAPSNAYGHPDDYKPYQVAEDDSPPPPPPPAHRVTYQASRATSMARQGSNPSAHTPTPPSPGAASHMTPSPLRDAMNDVMSSLQDMTVCPNEAQSPTSAPWSPEGLDLNRTPSYHQPRPPTVNEWHPREMQPRMAPVSNYVQRMESLHRPPSSPGEMPPPTPLKGTRFTPAFGAGRHTMSHNYSSSESAAPLPQIPQKKRSLRARKSISELRRTCTTKTNVTNSTESSSATQSSASTQITSRSIMSGHSAGGFSATSAGSLARRKFGLGSQKGRPRSTTETKSVSDVNSSARSVIASETAGGSGPSYHASHASDSWNQQGQMEVAQSPGGFGSPRPKRSGFFKKMIESAKTGAATARSTIGSRPSSPTKSLHNEPTGFAGGLASRPESAVSGGGGDWMQVRRDINRSNSLSQREREERVERCELLDLPTMRPIDQLHEIVEGDEGLDGLAVTEPTEFNTPSLALVDKSTRFIQSIPSVVSAPALAQNYICRPHRSDVQRLRAIFAWVAERITWEDDYEGPVDTRRVIATRRGCSQEITLLVQELCGAVGMYAEQVHGYLKAPGEVLDLDAVARPNHWWNAVIVDGEWRIMDCSLASPTNPRRSWYSSASSQVAEDWYFLARPTDICYTHIPLLPEQQHMVPPVPHEVLIMLPCACPAAFRHGVELADFDTSALYLENLEMAHLQVHVPEDVECVAETEARAFAQDADGDYFESGDLVHKRAFCQPEWINGRKRFTIKALLPGDEGQATLKIYAGKRGLMHSVRDNPHALALALPLNHRGQNPPYEFHIRHPTPHAQRHDLYVVQPQCLRLTLNNTFVFCVRQHPSSLSRFTPDTWGAPGSSYSNEGLPRPGSAMSMVSATLSLADSDPSLAGQSMTAAQLKPAKLAIQTPSQKIIRLTRKQELSSRGGGMRDMDGGLGSCWETVIKIGERGIWRGLVLADRSARWCVFAEWEC